MSKRFTDTDLWQKPWFMALTPEEKTAWFYLKDHCDAVGVWTPNERLANFQIGAEIDWQELAGKCNGNVELLENGKWFLPDFCFFQYGVLSKNCKPHVRYIADLEKHGLFERVSKGYRKGLETLEEKEQEKEKEKEKEEDTSYTTARPKKSKPASPDEAAEYFASINVGRTEAERFYDHYEANGWTQGKGKPIKDWKAAARNWKRNMREYTKPQQPQLTRDLSER